MRARALGLAVLVVLGGCRGRLEDAGEITAPAAPTEEVWKRERRQTAALRALGEPVPKQILFGDLHVHTTYSGDAFVFSLPLLQGEGVHRELELLVEEVDYAPLAAIRAATYDPARFLGVEDEWGRIAEGLVANIVLVEGNPAGQIADTRRIRYVIQNGRVVDREALAFDARTDPGFRTGTAVN